MNTFLSYIYAPNLPNRIGRIKSLAVSATNTIFCFICVLLNIMLFGDNTSSYDIISLIILFWLFNRVILNIKRIHDMNDSGWHVLIFLVPGVNFFYNLYLIFGSGDAQDNDFGSPPLKPTKLDYFLVASMAIFLILCLILSDASS